MSLSKLHVQKVCYFGNFDPDYSRNRVVIKGLRENGFEIVLCNMRTRGFKLYQGLYRRLKKLKGRYDIIIVGHTDNRWMVPLAKLLTRKPVIWDGFYSLYDSWVLDRRLVPRWHPKAWYYWLLDHLNGALADGVMVDTREHATFFKQKYSVAPRKILKVYVGSDIQRHGPGPILDKGARILVHFHGYYIPLQGVEHIVRAAALLKNRHIDFRFVGSGQEYERVRERADEMDATNISFVDRVPYDELIRLMSEADICLGIFGKTEKAERVIPNKVYEAIAMGKATVSGDTPAIRELFTDRVDILLCKMADPQDLADKIVELAEDGVLRKRIAEGGYLLYKNKLTPKHVVAPLIRRLAEL